MSENEIGALPVEVVPITTLRPHPKNYRHHPQDQLDHIAASIKEHRFYRNIVVARDGTILAGHGVWQAAQQIGLTELPVVRLDVDPNSPAALKVIAGDNEIARLAVQDDRLLSELLKQIKDSQDVEGLLGTGYDPQMLANLVFITRPASEIKDTNEAAEWVGMPEFAPGNVPHKIIVSFETAEDRDKFMALIGATAVVNKTGMTWSIWWPEKKKEAVVDQKFEEQPA